ncbi:MAG TPA: DinB family protein [Pyrinomonadaceae bacterium]
MSIGQMFAAELEREAVATKKMLERVPDDFTWKPHEKSTTLGNLATHIATLPNLVKATVKGNGLDLATNPFAPPTFNSGAEMAAAFSEGVAEAVRLLNDVSDEELSENWRLTSGEHVIFDLPRVAVLRTMFLSHLLHHRGQLSVYLRLKDVPLPSVYGPTADEQM